MWRGFAALAVLGFLVAQSSDTRAQSSDGSSLTPDQMQSLFKAGGSMSPDQIQGLLGGQGGNGDLGAALQQFGRNKQGQTSLPAEIPSVTPEATILQPAAPMSKIDQSAELQLEQIFSQRAGSPLKQFGYDQLGVGSPVSEPQVGSVQDDYVLGPGDEIVLALRGQANQEYRAYVDRDGRVSFPRINPISATGRTLGDFRRDLLAAIHRSYMATEGYVTVGGLREINVLVAGDVHSPGVRTMTGLGTIVDAILLSGGVSKEGSLRRISVIRGDHAYSVDLYSVLTGQGNSAQLTLADGDRVVVPPIGRTVAIAGFVRRPGIYELAPGQTSMSAGALLALGNGPLLPGSYSASVLRSMPDGKRQYVDISAEPRAQIRDGEIVVLKSSIDISLGRVTTTGAVRTPGAFSLTAYPTLHDLLPSPDALSPGAYILFGFIERTDPHTLQRQTLPFSPIHVIQGTENMKLISDDIVHVLTQQGAKCLIVLEDQRAKLEADQTKQLEQQDSQTQELEAQIGISDSSISQELASPEALACNPASAQQNQPKTIPSRGPLGLQQGQMLGGTMQGMGSSGMGMMPGLSAMGQGLPGMGLDAMQQGGAAAGMGLGNGMGLSGQTSGLGAGDQGAAAASDLGANGADAGAEGALGYVAGDSGFFGKRLIDYRVEFRGAVHDPGFYLIAPNTTLAEAITGIGGLSYDADLNKFELTSTDIRSTVGSSTTVRRTYTATPERLASILLQPYDRLEFHHVFADKKEGSVKIDGEVRYPGEYSFVRGEHLSSLLARAGGLTDQAYPYGTVYLRRSVAKLEEDSFRRTADEVENQLLAAISRANSATKIDPTAFTAAQSYVLQLRTQKGLGRIAVTADPAFLSAKPDQDPVLEAGDSIVIPQRPTTISVLGEVMQPGSYLYSPKLSAEDYVGKAGGVNAFADDSYAYVILPDGSAQKLDKGWLPYGSEPVPPGSVIVMPRDIAPLQWSEILANSSQIFSQLAVAGASLAVVSANTK